MVRHWWSRSALFSPRMSRILRMSMRPLYRGGARDHSPTGYWLQPPGEVVTKRQAREERMHTLFVFGLGLAACGGGGTQQQQVDAPVKDVGFNKPTASLHANTQLQDDSWMDLGAADLSCLNTASTDMPTAADVTLNTKVTDFQSGNIVPNATVTTFDNVDST